MSDRVVNLGDYQKPSASQPAAANASLFLSIVAQTANTVPESSMVQTGAVPADRLSSIDPNQIEVGTNMTNQENELRIQVSEARTDTKFAELIGKLEVGLAEIKGEIRTANARLDHVERATAGTKTTVIITGIAAVALVIAVLGYGQQWFGIGVSTRDTIRATVGELLQQQQNRPSGAQSR